MSTDYRLEIRGEAEVTPGPLRRLAELVRQRDAAGEPVQASELLPLVEELEEQRDRRKP